MASSSSSLHTFSFVSFSLRLILFLSPSRTRTQICEIQRQPLLDRGQRRAGRFPSGRQSIAIHHPQTRINNGGCLSDRANSSPRRGDNHTRVWLCAPGIIGLIATSVSRHVSLSATNPTIIRRICKGATICYSWQTYRETFEGANNVSYDVAYIPIVVTLSDRYFKRAYSAIVVNIVILKISH